MYVCFYMSYRRFMSTLSDIYLKDRTEYCKKRKEEERERES